VTQQLREQSGGMIGECRTTKRRCRARGYVFFVEALEPSLQKRTQQLNSFSLKGTLLVSSSDTPQTSLSNEAASVRIGLRQTCHTQ